MNYSAVRAIDLDKGKLEGLAIPFGGPLNGRDLHGETFTKDTDFALDWFSERPLLYQHGQDKALKLVPVGRQTTNEMKDDGVWAQAQMDTSNEYWGKIQELVDKGRLYFSSGSMGHLVQKSAGIIKQWPWVELTLTPNPANPYAVLDASESAKAFKAVGLFEWSKESLIAKQCGQRWP